MNGNIVGLFTGKEDAIGSVSQDNLTLDWDGVVSDRHYGRKKLSNVRETYVKRKTEILNIRQVSIVSKEELDTIARNLNIEKIYAEDLGANMLISGIKDFTKIPFGSIMKFEGGTMLLLTGDNYPCSGPGKEIAKRTGDKEIVMKFARNAMHLRGQVALILKPGHITIDESFEIIIPKEVTTGLSFKVEK